MKRIGWCVLAAFQIACVAGGIAQARAGVTVALHPVDLPDGLPDPAGARARIEAELTARLEAAGCAVIPSAESGTVWRSRVEAVGGFYDAFTGDTVRSKYEVVHRGTLRDLAVRLGVSHWLRGAVEVVVVEWKRGKAEWDGASEGVSPIGQGRVPALSLAVAVEDTSGAIIASGRGGIQVLAKVKGGGRFQDVPADKVLTDAKRLSKAADLALAPFLSRPGP